MSLNDDKSGHDVDHENGHTLFVIKLTAEGDPKKVIGYAMAEQIDFVADRPDLLGAAKEALEAAKGAFEQKQRDMLQAVKLGSHKASGVKMFAMIGSGNNNA